MWTFNKRVSESSSVEQINLFNGTCFTTCTCLKKILERLKYSGAVCLEPVILGDDPKKPIVGFHNSGYVCLGGDQVDQQTHKKLSMSLTFSRTHCKPVVGR